MSTKYSMHHVSQYVLKPREFSLYVRMKVNS